MRTRRRSGSKDQEESTATVGVIPAAGYATRLQPLAGSKEVYAIAGKPVMDYLVERMLTAGCSELRVVTRPEKTDVIANASLRGARVLLGYPQSVAESILTGIDGLPAETIVLFGFPDTIWYPEDGYAPLIAAVEAGHAVALGLFETAEPERSDVVTTDERGRIRAVEVKSRAPSSNVLWGCGAARARALWGLRDAAEPGAYFDSLCRQVPVAGVRLPGSFTDIGTREALARAQLG